jgi:hypothetical protein
MPQGVGCGVADHSDEQADPGCQPRPARPHERGHDACDHDRERGPEGASLSFTRLQDVLELTPGNLITHLRKLEDAGYLKSETTGNGRASRTSIALTRHGRAALATYTNALRDLLGGL